MRRMIQVAAATAVLACAAALPGTRAEAMAIPGAAAATTPAASVERVYLSCTRYWNGWRWVRRCVDAGPGYYGPGPGYYGPGPGYYGPGYGYGWRARRFYGYY